MINRRPLTWRARRRPQILLPEFLGAASSSGAPRLLELAQLDPPDLSGNGLRQRRELQTPDALVGRAARAYVLEDGARSLGVGPRSRRECDEGLRHREAQRIRTRYHGGFCDRVVLDEDTLELEGADAVVGGLEDIVHPADVREVALRIARGHIPGVVVAV